MRLLRAVSDSVLWLSAGNPDVLANLRAQAQRAGVDADRLVFAGRTPSFADHLARHAAADLFVDTLPYNAHTTAMDALWAGLPVLTHMGAAFAGRAAASMLNAMALPELIAHSQEEYEAKAIALATDAGRLREIKAKLAAKRSTTPLFNAPLYARHFMSALQAMHGRYQGGHAPDHIEIAV